jgi:hypothetical protein
MTYIICNTLEEAVTLIDRKWGQRPLLTLACIGGSDQHWQIWHYDDFQDDEPMPRYTYANYKLEMHPDAKGE